MTKLQLLVHPRQLVAKCRPSVGWEDDCATRPGSVAPEKCEDPENFADPQTKYLTYKPWARHLHYTHNFEGDPPPRAEKKKKVAAVLTPKMPWGLTLD